MIVILVKMASILVGVNCLACNYPCANCSYSADNCTDCQNGSLKIIRQGQN